MFKHYFELINGVEIFPIISLIMFFTVFVYVLIRVAFLKKSYISKMRDLPLESNNNKDYEN
jgi:Na+-transporting NADH:ubiquinone oxidoreductase subunit NqrF